LEANSGLFNGRYDHNPETALDMGSPDRLYLYGFSIELHPIILHLRGAQIADGAA